MVRGRTRFAHISLRLAVVPSAALALGACLNASMVVVGETPMPPMPPPPQISVLVVDDDGEPVPAAAVVFGGHTTTTDGLGAATSVWEDEPIAVSAVAPGYQTTNASIDTYSIEPLEIRLDPVVLTGRVVTADGVGLPDVYVRLGDAEATTGATGAFRLEKVVPGEILANRPAWLASTLDWDGEAETVEISLEPRMVKALHITGWTPQNAEAWNGLLDLADTTEIDALVVDLKDESGRVYYQSAVPLAEEVGATRDFYVLDNVVDTLRERDLYIIGRVVSFQDPIAARARNDLAIVNADGTPFEKNGQYFLDPTDPVARQYALDLAVEACAAGVQEIQFDYVRFPDGFSSSVRFDGGSAYLGAYNDPESGAARIAVIAGFLQKARDVLNPMGCAVAADVFAITLSVPDDQGIGQRPEELSATVDVLSPMIYPDHYSDGSFGYGNPFDHPGPVVDSALAAGMPRLPATTIMRPWLADYYYGPAEVRAEIDAAEEYGIGWMLWNANSNHTPGALETDQSGPSAN